MKIRLIAGIIFIILGILIAFGPLTIFPVCGVHTAQEMTGQESDQENDQESMQMDETTSEASKEDAAAGAMTMETMVMKCFWTARAELGIGILIVLLGILLIVIPSVRIRQGVNISLILNGILAFVIPIILIGVCDNVHMSCHSLTLPALLVLSSIEIIAAVVHAVFLYKLDKKDRSNHEASSTNN